MMWLQYVRVFKNRQILESVLNVRVWQVLLATNPQGGNVDRLPQLVPDQALKLKQLTVLTLAETNKVLPYDQLMQELDVTNVRELEDFLINECMYAGIVRGKLDQLRRCFEV
ncbi:COP9 signalosome complex subunit 7 [Vitis vinifera]|uniref:COP9 signalosome complex subunit 7 n=1 Tax=Vitis vinifera TaxID=29760 RepID=A0A438DA30_VITVI|nr:COP9 signalosome complex subunit 7 [Vitis vinifera]